MENIKLEDQNLYQEALQEYLDSGVAKKNNDYFDVLPYWKEYAAQNRWAKIIAWVGHCLSVVIGSCCGYYLGFALFSGFDVELWTGFTLGTLLGILMVLTMTSLWEITKHRAIHRFFKVYYQFKGTYTKSRDYAVLLILVGVSMALSGYGGFEVVTRWFGEAETSAATVVDVDLKVEHLRASLASQDSTLAGWERSQQQRVAMGKERMYKLDKAIIVAQAERSRTDSTLSAQIAFWEHQNLLAGGVTKQDNDDLKAEHNADMIWYSLLFALLALTADLVTLYSIRYNERYRYISHMEMAGVDSVESNNEKQNHKMKVVYSALNRKGETTPQDSNQSGETTDGQRETKEKPEETTPKNETGNSENTKPVHGQCFWQGNQAMIWFQKSTDGSIVGKNARSLKGMRNKAKSRANTAKSDEARKNNLSMYKYYDELYQELLAFQKKEAV